MAKDFKVFISQEYSSRDIAVYNLIRNGTMFRLTGADEIKFDFCKNGSYTMQFLNRGNIFGTFLEIIPNRKVSLDWNVNGFGRDEEVGTKVIISIIKIDKGVIIEAIHSGIRNKISSNAKHKAWTEILKNMQQELVLLA